MKLKEELFKNKKIVIVTHRAPISPIKKTKATIIQKSSGGLVSALDPIMEEFNGMWFCTISKSDKLIKQNLDELPYKVVFLELTEKELEEYYEGYSNKQLWPIFHYFPSNCIFNDEDWFIYKSVNEKMANLILENIPEDEDCYIWIHDYHFLLLPGILREKNPNLNIGLYLHIPFPNQEVFRLLGNRSELMKGMLGADLIGFHTKQYVEHFINCVRILMPGVYELMDKKDVLNVEGRQVLVDAFPISIDFEHISQKAASEEIIKEVGKLKAAYQTDFLGIGVDRLDYTKGLIERLIALECFFENYPEYIKRVTFVQLVVPSRVEVETYKELKKNIDEVVGRINGRFSRDGWRPIFYIYGSMPPNELIAHYTMSDFALITPLRDGMNLVAKEYIASKVNNKGVLILSEFAGVSEELSEALLVNPYQKFLLAKSIKEAIEMPMEEKIARMHTLREKIRANDVYKWVNNYIESFYETIKSNKRFAEVY